MQRETPIVSPERTLRRQLACPLLALPLALLLSGCSIKGMAINGVANALAGQGGDGEGNVYLTDDDPILVGEALPFSLKLMETILQETPEHEGLLVATATGFVSYAEMWVLRPSRYLEDTDYYAAMAKRRRATKLFLRARDYAGRALDLKYPGITERLRQSPEEAVLEFEADDVPTVYWYTAALGRAISTDPSDAELLVQGRTIQATLARCLELDESWNQGALHELQMGIPEQLGGSPEKAEAAYERAMELNQGRSVGPMVALAESVLVPRQDREGFERILNQVLRFDSEQYRENRLVNILAQQHAEWLLGKADDLFWMDSGSESSPPERRMRDPWPIRP
jgi:predicted anti-sigma-YlaC factor YlaD